MKIIAIMPVHGREVLSMESVLRLKRQTHVRKVVVAGDSSLESRIAEAAGAEFVSYPNEPLSLKFQAALYKARELSPDAVLVSGSDNFLSKDWARILAGKIKSGADVAGISRLWQCLAYPGKKIEMHEFAYRNQFADEPYGAGRLISRTILEKCEWNIFRIPRNSGCDRMSYETLKAAGARVAVPNEDERLQVLNVRLNPENVTPLDALFKRAEMNDGIALITSLTGDQREYSGFMNKYFPGLAGFLQDCVSGIFPGEKGPSSAKGFFRWFSGRA